MKNFGVKSNAADVIFTNVTKVYGQNSVAVDQISFNVKAGELMTLLGPSGCGKTTTLRMIAGLEAATSGTIVIGESDVTNRPASDRDVSMVFQSYALYPHMTIQDNLSFGLRMMKGSDKLDEQEIQSRVDEIADLLDLSQHLQKKPKELSGGQRQRVALGRALVRRPKVLLMDEPLSNLDAELRHQMRNEIRRLHDELGTTTIYVTHDQIEAMTLADRIAILNNGELQQHCAPLEAYHNPANDFVRSFLCKHIDDLVQTANSLFNNPSTSSEDSE